MQQFFEPLEVVRLYRIWTSILYRCTKKTNKQYKNYGGRGINICDEWLNFNKFVQDVYLGSKEGLHLDRKDNDKGYNKENCRWVSPKVNHRNKRTNHYYETHLGKMAQSELIEYIGYTKRQFQRAIERLGEDKFLELFKENNLPKKRVYENFNLIIGKKFGKFTVLELDPDKSTGARYFCICDCGKKTRVSRHKLLNGLSKNCLSCSRLGDLNPNSTRRHLKQAGY